MQSAVSRDAYTVRKPFLRLNRTQFFIFSHTEIYIFEYIQSIKMLTKDGRLT